MKNNFKFAEKNKRLVDSINFVRIKTQMAFSLVARSSLVVCKFSHAEDAAYIRRAADLADKSAGFTSPHANFGCVIATSTGKVAGEGYLYAQGTRPAEVEAVEAGGPLCRGSTAYLNMEPGDCHGDHTAVSALVQVCCAFLFSLLFFLSSQTYVSFVNYLL